jgi:hypothetical protein
VIDRLPRASWRLVVATVALVGFAPGSAALDTLFQELGTLACLATGLLYLTLAVVGGEGVTLAGLLVAAFVSAAVVFALVRLRQSAYHRDIS